VAEIELCIHEQREADLARDRLDRLSRDDQLGRVLPSVRHLAVLGQRGHVGDGVADPCISPASFFLASANSTLSRIVSKIFSTGMTIPIPVFI